MSDVFKVMLATDYDPEKLRFPCVATPKLDGIRAYVQGGVVLSRNNKPIPNLHVQTLFSGLEHYDGELIVGSPTSSTVFRDTTSGVMSKEGKPNVTYYVFDHLKHLSSGWQDRIENITAKRKGVVVHSYTLVDDIEALMAYEALCVDMGYEGLILRDPDGRYKQGRSTVNEGYLLKLKRFQDAEAVVIGFEERMHNGNEATVNELGRTKRSSHKANKSGRGDLGALVCRTAEGIEFNIGTGFTDADRASIWERRDQFLGQLAKYKFFPVGQKEAPRHPVFLGWRDVRDM